MSDPHSDGGLDPRLFRPDAVRPEIRAFNARLVEVMTPIPNWWDVGARAIREARRRGEGPFPPPVLSPRAVTRSIDSPHGHAVELRVIAPETSPTGVYLHIHGGGWTLGAADAQDPMLERIVASTGMAAVSVEYRLAPENPYPAGPDDCEAAALWLVRNAQREFGTAALAIGGESAGAHLAAVTLLRLRDRHGYTGFRGANLVYGAFDLGMTPSQRRFGDERLVLRTLDIEKFREAFLPGGLDFADPDISPLYADLTGLCPALFTIGTADALLDDSLFMHARWIAAGNPAELAIYPGGPHGFTLMGTPQAAESGRREDAFLARVIAA